MFLRTLTCCIILALTGTSALAQDVARKTESEAETIARCLRDLQSKDKEVRKRAVMIIGKYTSYQAQAALVRSLSDSEASIRRSALVALINQPLMGEQAKAMLAMIGDPDASNRRIASSHVAKLIIYARSGTVGNFGEGRDLPKATTEMLKKAFTDKDATVRKNMVANWRSMLGLVFADRELVLGRLKDKERDVRVLALQAAPMLAGSRDFVPRVEGMVKDPDAKIRLLLAQTLARRSWVGREAILKKMAQDEDFRISTEAWYGLFASGDKDAWPELEKRLAGERLNADQAGRIIALIPILGDTGKPVLEKLMGHKRTAFRLSALKAYSGSYWKAVSPELLLKLLQDPSAEIRKTAATLFIRIQNPPLATIKKLSGSKHADVRYLALGLATKLQKDKAEDIVMELLIDDDATVRSGAIAIIAHMKFEDWEDVLTDSLDDDSVEVQREAVRSLLRSGGTAGRKILDKFVKNTKNDALKRFIELRLDPWAPRELQPGP